LPEKIGPENRRKFMAYDGANNLFNLAYEVLSWKVHRALTRAKLEPYLGFLHSLQWGKPSLVCDFQEIYRYLIDDFVVRYSQMLTARDFTTKTEILSRNKRGKTMISSTSLEKSKSELFSGENAMSVKNSEDMI
jgi:CRISPR-associated protein Cas1